MKIHTFGDSHSCNGWDYAPSVIQHHLGPILCYSIGRDGLNRLNIQHYGVENGDTVIFSFGEIDCRSHIKKYITANTPFTVIIDNIIDKYVDMIRQNINQFANIYACIYNIVPPIQRHNTPENHEYPYLGADEERKQYVLYFNYKLREICRKYHFTFVDIYDKYTDKNGYLNKLLSDGKVHIKDGTYIQEFVANHLLYRNHNNIDISSKENTIMQVGVSIGEVIDKLSILELKYRKIPDENKKTEIQKEIAALTECITYKKQYAFYYNMLMYVNEKIWDMTDTIKSFKYTDNPGRFASISNQIFEFNQKRFRIKNWFNLLVKSDLKEQKSYAASCCNICIEDESTLYRKIREINYLLLEYDNVVFTVSNKILEQIKAIYSAPNNTPTIIYDSDITASVTIQLRNFSIPETETKRVFDFIPIAYVAGGMFGDFIHMLSVINENFCKTGRKGVLYITNGCSDTNNYIYGDIFRNGAEKTYNDTYPVIINQQYIYDYFLYIDNKPDINLHNTSDGITCLCGKSCMVSRINESMHKATGKDPCIFSGSLTVNLNHWRSNPKLFDENWYHTFKQTYGVEWGTHQWLQLPAIEKWKNKVLVNTVSYRWPDTINFQQLYEQYDEDLVFISADEGQYHHFTKTTSLNIPFVKITAFYELCEAIQSCKLFVGSLSAPMAIAYATYTPCLISHSNLNECSNLNLGLDEFLPHITFCYSS